MSCKSHHCEKVTSSNVLGPHRPANCLLVAVLHVLHSTDIRLRVELPHTRGRHHYVFLLLAIV